MANWGKPDSTAFPFFRDVKIEELARIGWEYYNQDNPNYPDEILKEIIKK